MAPAQTYCVKEVCVILGISRSTLSERRAHGKFPQPIIESPLRWARHQIDGILLTTGSQGSSPTSASFSSSHTTHSQDSRPAAGGPSYS